MPKKRHSLDHSQRGIALLIAIFVLLLISVVAIALLVSSGTETALGANYRSSSTVYYAALAGLEEARGRLLAKNPNSLAPGTITPGTTLPIGYPIYITNPSAGDTVDPTDPTSPYYDSEYLKEFPASGFSNAVAVPSVWQSSSVPGPLYKWVRVTAATEYSINADVDYDRAPNDSSTPLFYDPANIATGGTPWPSLIVNSSPPSTAVQALEITALAYLPNGTPNGSKKILQYVVAPISPNLTFTSALTMSGNNVTFSVPTSNAFDVDGNDHAIPGVCSPSGSPPAVAAVGYTNNSDSSRSNITSTIPPSNRPYYTGLGGSTPNINYIGGLLATNLQSVGGLDTLVQTISQNADVSINGPATQSDMPSAMSPTNPMTIVVNGDLTFNGWHSTGYGLLLVTGTFTFDPDATWDGIVLVIGKGVLYTHQGGVGQFNGAVFLATTVDSSGNPLPTSSPLGSPYFHFTAGAGGHGVYYSSCAVQWAQTPLTYKVVSFHEIAQ